MDHSDKLVSSLLTSSGVIILPLSFKDTFIEIWQCTIHCTYINYELWYMLKIFSIVVKYTQHKFTILTIFEYMSFGGVRCIHVAGQTISRTLFIFQDRNSTPIKQQLPHISLFRLLYKNTIELWSDFKEIGVEEWELRWGGLNNKKKNIDFSQFWKAGSPSLLSGFWFIDNCLVTVSSHSGRGESSLRFSF